MIGSEYHTMQVDAQHRESRIRSQADSMRQAANVQGETGSRVRAYPRLIVTAQVMIAGLIVLLQGS